VSVLNLGRDIGYPNSGISWFPHFPAGKYRYVLLLLGDDRFLPNPFQLTFLPIILPLDPT
jgi:hypothetical protein